MEGRTSTGTLPSQNAGVNVNMLRGWLEARNAVRRRLMRSSLIATGFAGIALLVLPLVAWLFTSERIHRVRVESSLRQVKVELGAAQQKLLLTQPKMDRSRKFEQIQQRTKNFVNSALRLAAATPESVVLNSISVTSVQGKLTMRVVADASGTEQKALFEARASTGSHVLAAFVTSQTREETVYPKGIRFEFVRIAEVGP